MGSNEKALIKYFEILIKESKCKSCEIKYRNQDNETLNLSLALPPSQEKVAAGMIFAKIDIERDFCYNVTLVILKKYYHVYKTAIENKCMINENGNWEFKTGVKINNLEEVILYSFDPFNGKGELEEINMFAISAEVVYR